MWNSINSVKRGATSISDDIFFNTKYFPYVLIILQWQIFFELTSKNENMYRFQCTNWCNFWRHLHIQNPWKFGFTSSHSNIPNTQIRVIGILQMLHQYPETWAKLARESRCQLYSKWNFLANLNLKWNFLPNLDLKYTKVSNCPLREGNFKYQRTFWPSH